MDENDNKDKPKSGITVELKMTDENEEKDHSKLFKMT